MTIWDVAERGTIGLAAALAMAARGCEVEAGRVRVATPRDSPGAECPGSAPRYRKGCRCEKCKAAHADRTRRYRRERAANMVG